MDVKSSVRRFDQAIEPLPPRIRSVLAGVPQSVKESAFEVRLRAGRPISLICPERCWFVDESSRLYSVPCQHFLVGPEDLAQAVVSMCAYSVHSHQQELADGYISLRGGHRAGICGTAVMDKNRVTAVRDITSVNLRIAREVQGTADQIIKQVFRGGAKGLLIVGAPSSGKTTLLRDLTRQLSDGLAGAYIKVAVVDERGELGAVFQGVPQNDLGASCDILNHYPKGQGILTAVRTLSPQVIVVDELGDGEEVDRILDGVNCGVKIVATAHGEALSDIKGRRQVMRLIHNGVFDYIALLGRADRPGTVEKIVEAGELLDEDHRVGEHRAMLYHDGDVHGVGAVGAGTCH